MFSFKNKKITPILLTSLLLASLFLSLNIDTVQAAEITLIQGPVVARTRSTDSMNVTLPVAPQANNTLILAFAVDTLRTQISTITQSGVSWMLVVAQYSPDAYDRTEIW